MHAISIPLVVGKPDWIARTKTARDLLIAAHGFRSDDFVTVDASLRDDVGISMNWCPTYPRAWRDCFLGRPRNWIAEEAFPLGLTLFWPSGLDICDEAYDPQDPIFILAEVLFWENMTEAEFRSLCEAK